MVFNPFNQVGARSARTGGWGNQTPINRDDARPGGRDQTLMNLVRLLSEQGAGEWGGAAGATTPPPTNALYPGGSRNFREFTGVTAPLQPTAQPPAQPAAQPAAGLGALGGQAGIGSIGNQFRAIGNRFRSGQQPGLSPAPDRPPRSELATPTPSGPPTSYGYGPEAQFFENNSLFPPPAPVDPNAGGGGFGGLPGWGGDEGGGGGGRAGYEGTPGGGGRGGGGAFGGDMSMNQLGDALGSFASMGSGNPFTRGLNALASVAFPTYGLARLGAWGLSKLFGGKKTTPGAGRTDRGGGGYDASRDRDLDRESRAATGERTSQRGGMGGL